MPFPPSAAASLVAAALLAAPASAASVHCGTMLRLERASPLAKGSARLASAPAARTLETAHFTFNYSLRGIHRVKIVSPDQAFMRVVDSLYDALPDSLDAVPADREVYRKLDSLGAGHPLFVTTMAGFFEAARGYYVDTLRMRAPAGDGPSYFYRAPNRSRKFDVDIADIGKVEPAYDAQIYALTFPAPEGGMLMENDFLYHSRLDPTGTFPLGDSIMSTYDGRVIHNYGIDWEDGLKVTSYHEFYHAEQFAYVPVLPFPHHVWYETAATGMEERKAPEVNDYLQYLPDLFDHLQSRSMFEYPGAGLSEYGNGIFHLFLTKELAEDFDTRVWARLAENGNAIEEALARVFAHYGKTGREVFARYAAQLAFAGTSAKAPMPLFSPDLPLWPRLDFEPLDLSKEVAYSTPILQPYRVKALRFTGAPAGGNSAYLPDTVMGAALVRLASDTAAASTVEILRARARLLDVPDESGKENLLVFSNGSLTRRGRAEIKVVLSRQDSVVYPYPNPTPSGEFTYVTFSRVPAGASVRVYGEGGMALDSLAFPPASTFWAWDLTDAAGSPLKPGVYYYRVGDGPARVLYLKPPQ